MRMVAYKILLSAAEGVVEGDDALNLGKNVQVGTVAALIEDGLGELSQCVPKPARRIVYYRPIGVGPAQCACECYLREESRPSSR